MTIVDNCRGRLLIHGNVTDVVFFILCKIYIFFSFGFMEALDSKGILDTPKKGITAAMQCADVALSLRDN